MNIIKTKDKPNYKARVVTGDVFDALSKIPGGYEYSGICSFQICFPLKNGGELRFMMVDSDMTDDEDEAFSIDHYGAELPPMITGTSKATGEEQ